MLHLSCCGCSERDSGFDGGVQRAERAACRRYAIMVGSFPSRFFDACFLRDFWWNFCYHNRVSTTHYPSYIIVTPHNRYLRHRLCGANHNRASPRHCSLRSPSAPDAHAPTHTRHPRPDSRPRHPRPDPHPTPIPTHARHLCPPPSDS